MCGIAGFIDQRTSRDFETCLRRMGDAISYRGPDDFGLYHKVEIGLGLVHRRLAIVDLSELAPISTGHLGLTERA